MYIKISFEAVSMVNNGFHVFIDPLRKLVNNGNERFPTFCERILYMGRNYMKRFSGYQSVRLKSTQGRGKDS